jgi:hypothetical protein
MGEFITAGIANALLPSGAFPFFCSKKRKQKMPTLQIPCGSAFVRKGNKRTRLLISFGASNSVSFYSLLTQAYLFRKSFEAILNVCN